MKKKILSFILAFVFVLTGAICLPACSGGDLKQSEKLAYVSLDINPGIELIVDQNNKVISVRGENEDGLVLLYDEIGIKGEDINTVISKITNLAVQYGYLDSNNKVIETIVSSDNKVFASEIKTKINATVAITADNLGLNITTDDEGAYSLIRRMEEYKKEFPNNSAIQNMTISKFKLALSVSETGEISLDTAVLLDDAELIKILKEVSPKIEAYATKEYLKAKAEALVIFDQVAEIPSYSVYTQYYLTNILKHPLTAYYGGVYQMYASAAKAFDALCDVVELAGDIYNYPLDKSEINDIVTALGMESSEALKNSDGEITIESIEAYADKLFKNTPASVELERTKEALSNALRSAETVVKEEVAKMLKTYEPQINQAKTTAEQVLTTIQSTLNVLPENLKSLFNTLTEDLQDILATVNNVTQNGKVDAKELRKVTEKLEEKADEWLNKIKEDLTEEEFADLQAKQQTEINKMATKRQEFESALNTAKTNAQNYLANLKSQLGK